MEFTSDLERAMKEKKTFWWWRFLPSYVRETARKMNPLKKKDSWWLIGQRALEATLMTLTDILEGGASGC